MTIQAKTPTLSIFQVKTESVTSKASQAISPSDYDNPYVQLISPGDGNVISFEYGFKDDKHDLSVRVVDPNLELFQKFFTSFNYIGRLNEIWLDENKSFSKIIADIASDIQGQNKQIAQKQSQEGNIDEDENYSKTVIDIINENLKRRRKEIEEKIDNQPAGVGLKFIDTKPSTLGPKFHEWKARRQRRIDSYISNDLGRIGFYDLNSEEIAEYMTSYSNRRFIAQISDGTNESLHFDVVLTKLRMFSNSDNLLMVDLVFTTSGENKLQGLEGNSNTNSGKVPTGLVGLCTIRERNLSIFDGLTTKVNTGLTIPDPGPKRSNRTLTTIEKTTKQRLENIQKCIEAAIASFLYEFDTTYDLHHYLVFLTPEINVKIIREIDREADWIMENAEENSRFSRDKVGAYIKAMKTILKELGFLVVPAGGSKISSGPTYPYEGKTTTYYIKVNPRKTYRALSKDKFGETVGEDVDVTKPRKFITGLIQSMNRRLDIRSVRMKFQPASTWMWKDLIINCLSNNDELGDFVNPLYSSVNDSGRFPLESSNEYLKRKGRTYPNRPLLILCDSKTQQWVNTPFNDLNKREALRRTYRENLKAAYLNADRYDSVITPSRLAGASSNIEELYNRGWLEDDVIEKFSRLSDISTEFFETPVFVFNDVNANVLDFESVDQNFAFAFFKTKPPAFAKRVFYNPVDFLGFDNYDSIKQSFKSLVESAEAVAQGEEEEIPNADLKDFGTQIWQYRDDVLTEISRVGNIYQELYEMINNVVMEDLEANLTELNLSEKFRSNQAAFIKASREIFNEFIDSYSTDTVNPFGFLEFLEYFITLSKFTHSLKIRTTPMFHISYDNVAARGCFFKGKIPASPQNKIHDPFDVGINNLIFNGAYTIVNYNHVANETECYSEFTLVKPGITKVQPSEPPTETPQEEWDRHHAAGEIPFTA